jgi:hypothetical protein
MGKKAQVKQRPRQYAELPQQTRFRQALDACGVRKGITKAEMMDKMQNCIPQFFQAKREEEQPND